LVETQDKTGTTFGQGVTADRRLTAIKEHKRGTIVPQVEVRTFGDDGTGSPSARGEINIRELCERAGQGAAYLVDYQTESGLQEKPGRYEIEFAVPGFGASELRVTASESDLIVHAANKYKREKDEGTACFWEFGEKELFRHFRLGAPIDPLQVVAWLERGVLHVAAAKQAAAQRTFAAAASGGGISSAGMDHLAIELQAGAGTQRSPHAHRLLEVVGQYTPGRSLSEHTTIDELNITSLDRLVLVVELEKHLGIFISETELVGTRTLGELALIARDTVQSAMPGWS
jgi:HSP20 family molecular chaperone IbpA/acyl carrier protein